MKQLWPAVMSELHQSGGALAALLEGARPVDIDREEAVLMVGFPSSSTFNKRAAEAPEKRDELARAVEAVTGERLRPAFVLLDGEAAAEPAASGRRPAAEPMPTRWWRG